MSILGCSPRPRPFFSFPYTRPVINILQSLSFVKEIFLGHVLRHEIAGCASNFIRCGQIALSKLAIY